MNEIAEDVKRVLKWIECQGYDDVFTRTSVINDLVPVNFSTVDDVLDQEARKGNIEIVGIVGFKYPLLKRARKMDKSIGIGDDIRRVSKWIDTLDDDVMFRSFDIWNSFCGVLGYEVIDAVITAKLNRNELIISKPNGTYYMKKAGVEKVNTDIKSQLLDIEILLKKIYEKVDALPEKKQRISRSCRLWIQHNMQTVPPGGMLFEVDVMLASGEVLLNMRADQVAWRYYPDDPTNVIAWRKAK